MDWVIFWAIVALYWVVALKRMPLYYHRVDAYNREHMPYTYKDTGMKKESAWGAIGLAIFWPCYEAGRWVQNHVIRIATAEQRKQQEYENAARIVAEYTKNKEREEREAFDRELRGS